jgi:rare lipoprotein A
MRQRLLLSCAVLLPLCLCFASGCARHGRAGAELGAGAGGGAGRSESGLASYYADKFHGRKTASGETFDQTKLTAAHRTLPFGTQVRVTNVSNGKFVAVRVNDRGPFIRGRVIDLSRAAAEKLGMVRAGVADVRVEVLRTPTAVAAGRHE